MDILFDTAVSVLSPAFCPGGQIPIQHTGRGADQSPPLDLGALHPLAQSIAVTMDDLDIPLLSPYNHWCVWNLPVGNFIPGAMPAGKHLESGAVQGIGYGKHRYRGPKPPFGTHRYLFAVYVLDCTLQLSADCRKKTLLAAMEGHILQTGTLMGLFG